MARVAQTSLRATTLALALMASAHANTTITVTSSSSGTNDGSGCTLRDAVQAVNARAATGQCPAGSGPVDTINLPANINAFTQRDAHSANAALPALVSGRSLNIYGNQNNGTSLLRDHTTPCSLDGTTDATDFRLIEVNAGAALYLQDVSLEWGCADGLADAQTDYSSLNARGGAIANYGALYLVRSFLFNNSANGFGGAIYNGPDAQLGVSYSTFDSNSSHGGGGAVFVDTDDQALAEFDATLFRANTAYDGKVTVLGGAIRNLGTVSVLNDTFNANTASDGGAIYNAGYVGVSFSTFHNDGGAAPELAIAANSFAYVKSSLFGTQNFNNTNCTIGAGATVSWSGVSISNDTSCNGGANITGTYPGFDPNLGSNGGPTQTFKLHADSPALGIDVDCTDVNGDPVTLDQRGFPRPLTHCDAGAFEGDLIFANGFES